MALVEDDLPGVRKVRGDFQLREDQGLAQRLQEQEYEEHFNSNVQLRRTARHDVNVAKEFQDKETQSFQQQEKARLQLLREREEQDREHAAEVTRKLEEEEQKLREREEQDKEHAAKIAQKIKEEEDIQMALRMQDEAMAKKMQETEAKKRSRKLQQEESDARLARQASLGGQRSAGSSREGSLSDKEVQRMKQLKLQGGGSPQMQRSLDGAAARPRHVQDPKTVTSSLPATLRATTAPSLPSYDQCVPDGYGWSDGVGGEEPVMDENERIALQEAEDERLAREMLQKEEDERKKRELEDMEFARRMQQQESTTTASSSSSSRQPRNHDKDLEIARKLHEEEEARRKNLQSAHERDTELARRLHQEEARKGKPQQQPQQQRQPQQQPQQQRQPQQQSQQQPQQQRQQPQGAPAQHDADVELAMRLQREEVMKHKELKRQRLAQQKVMEQQRLEQQQQRLQQRQQPGPPNSSTSSQQPLTAQPGASRFAGYEVPPLEEDTPGPHRSAPAMQQSGGEGNPGVPSQQGSPGHILPEGHPFNSTTKSFYAYQPGVTGVQIPRGSKAPAASAQAKPSYKRSETGKKKKK